jgi:hypothetical protein
MVYCEDFGIHKQLTQPQTPQQNGVAKHMNRSLLDKTRSIMLKNKTPNVLLTKVFATTTYVKNKSMGHTHKW